ncbi:hypothetical protein BOX15_Mlig019622g2, partial [Macrostomum lignano]
NCGKDAAAAAAAAESDDECSEPEAQLEADGEAVAAAKQSKLEARGARELGKVTDYVEEAELAGGRSAGGEIGEAMRAVSARQALDQAEKQRRERELSKVKVAKEHADLLAREFEISQSAAERCLRENGADLDAALRALLTA